MDITNVEMKSESTDNRSILSILPFKMKYPSNSAFSRLKQKILDLKDLQTSLYDFQILTLQWMHNQEERRGILGLHMGMGKTLIILTHYLLNPDMKFLYICPKNVFLQLNEYISTHLSPEIRKTIQFLHGFKSTVNSRTNFLICTYGTVTSLYRKSTRLNYLPNVIVLDESHVIRNSKTLTARACKFIEIDPVVNQKWLLSGTPLVNRSRDLDSQLDFLDLSFIPEWSQKYYITFDQRIILNKLPKISVFMINVNMTEKQAQIYQKYRYELMAQLRSNHHHINQFIIAKICYLKQIAIHSDLIKSKSEQEVLINPVNPLNPFKFNLKGLIVPSNKFLEIKWLLAHAISGIDQIIIYSQYTKALLLLNRYLKEIGHMDTDLLIGATRNKGELLRNFKQGKFRILLCNIISSGTGLNLQNANHVIFLDHWWNSVLEKQAIARVYRLGQEKPVKIFFLTSNHSIETYISEQKYYKNLVIDSIYRNDHVENHMTIKQVLKNVLQIYVKDLTEKKASTYIPFYQSVLPKFYPVLNYLFNKIHHPDSNYIQNYFKNKYLLN